MSKQPVSIEDVTAAVHRVEEAMNSNRRPDRADIDTLISAALDSTNRLRVLRLIVS